MPVLAYENAFLSMGSALLIPAVIDRCFSEENVEGNQAFLTFSLTVAC